MSALSSCLGLMEKEEEPELFGDSELLSLRCEILRFNGLTAMLRSLTARRGLSERSSGWFWSMLDSGEDCVDCGLSCSVRGSDLTDFSPTESH